MLRAIAILYLLIVAISCNDEVTNDSVMSSIGTVSINEGLSDCDKKIVLDNGETIIPTNWEDFNFVANDRVRVEYELKLKTSTCEGLDCRLLSSELVEAIPYVDLYFFNYDSLKRDPVKINEVSFNDNSLRINLSYSGGCKNHIIDLARLHPSCGTPPLPPPTFEIRHDSNGDLCEAWLTKTYYFDLSPLKEEFDNTVKIVFQANESGDSFYTEELTIKIE